nr:hypothetical protein [Tanacetum cinerariifolium]
MVDGEWMDDPSRVKEEFRSHFTTRFQAPGVDRSRAVDAGIFMGIKIDSSLTISHLFYADDVVFIGEWSNANLTGVGTSNDTITTTALNLGCSVMKTPFKYLRVMVGGSTPIYNMSLYKVPKSVLHLMESIRRNFFNGIQGDERKITWVKWDMLLFLFGAQLEEGLKPIS